MKAVILGLTVALIAIAQVNAEAKLRSANANNAPSYKLMNVNDFDDETQKNLGRQVAAQLNGESSRKDSHTGRFFFKKWGNQGQSQQAPMIIPIVITSGGTGGGNTSPPLTITSTVDIEGDADVTSTPTGAARGADNDDVDDENEERQYVIEEEEINDDNVAADFQDEEKAANGKKNNGGRRKTVTFVIPPQYRKYFNNRKRLAIPVSMIQNAQKNRVGSNKRRTVRRKGNRRN